MQKNVGSETHSLTMVPIMHSSTQLLPDEPGTACRAFAIVVQHSSASC